MPLWLPPVRNGYEVGEDGLRQSLGREARKEVP